MSPTRSCEQALALVMQDDADELRSALGAGLDPDCRLSDRSTLLMAAAEAGKPAVTHVLVKEGADVNAVNDQGWTALMYAAAGGNVEIVTWLLDSGADWSKRAVDGMTALDIAENRTRFWRLGVPFTRHLIIVRLPFSRGDDPTAEILSRYQGRLYGQ